MGLLSWKYQHLIRVQRFVRAVAASKKDLKLSERIYRYKEYALMIDRDFDASLNLANYQST